MLAGAVLMAVDQPEHPQLHMALNAHLLANKKSYFGAAPFKPIAPTEYRAELVDLNADGIKEALVLMLGRYWGGTGGQTMFIFRGTEERFKFVGRMTCVRFPMEGSVCVMKSKSNGWRDLAVRLRGRGASQKYAHMKFGATRYPLNPTTEQELEGWPGSDYILISGDGTAKSLPERGTYLTGVLGKSIRVQVRLEHDKGKVTGEYYYEKYGTPIQLAGIASGSQVVLREIIKDQPQAELRLKKGPKEWTGEWKSIDGKKRFPLRLNLVSTERFVEHSGLLESHVQTCYLALMGKTGDRFNVLLANVFTRRYQKAVKEYEESLKSEDVAEAGESMKRWSHDDSASIHYFSDDLISVRGSNWNYTGGAHGNSYCFDLNYWWNNGKPKALELSDLFDSKKNWRGVVGRFIRSGLKKQGASWPPKTDSEAVETTFTFSPSGVEFHYPPYAVGSYAEGYYQVLVPYSVLRPVLDKVGPLARWVK
jgi:hypothetical protein